MALADILSNMESDELPEAKMTLTRVFHATVKAAALYADTSLKAADDVLRIAMDGGSCASAYIDYTNVTRYHDLAMEMVENVNDVSNILLMLNHSEDDEANEDYADYLAQASKSAEIAAKLEGATKRVDYVNKAMPKNPQPAARFDASVFATEELNGTE